MRICRKRYVSLYPALMLSVGARGLGSWTLLGWKG